MAGQIPFTPRAKKVLELAMREALSLGHNYIGTEHILLGLVRENEGVAAWILLDFDADAEKIRNEVIQRLPQPEAQRPDLPDVPRAKFVFTDDEHRDQCAAAGCQHPSVYIFATESVQGWCRLCRAVAYGDAG